MFLDNRCKGFTLVEVMIALAVSGLLLVGLTRLYTTTLKSYSLQEQMTEMNQNAKFVIREISDVIAQSGADCAAINLDSTDKDTIIAPTAATCSDFTIKVNPRGGLFFITAPCTIAAGAKCSVLVVNASQFRFADSVGRIPKPLSLIKYVNKYKLEGANPANNKICIRGRSSHTDTFYVDDAIYSFASNRYYLQGTNLCLNGDTNVLAENIDSFKVTFLTIGNAVTTNWQTMRSANLLVEATTSAPDPKYPGDGKRRLKLTYKFRLKNKV